MALIIVFTLFYADQIFILLDKKRPMNWDCMIWRAMHFEWCNDWYDENYYGKSPGNDPKGPATGPHRVIRGGNWASEPNISRLAHRIPVQLGYGAMGFRLTSSL